MSPQPCNADITFALGLEPDHGFQQLLIERLQQLQPVFALPLHGRGHLSCAQLLLTVFGKEATPLGQTGLQRQCLQAILAHSADLDQLLP